MNEPDHSNKDRIYFDNAATSYPKPESVYNAVDQFQRDLGAAAGRGGYRAAIASDKIVSSTRSKLARLINAESDRQIAFTFNGTDSLNLALFGLLKPGDHVVTTTLEHNSILRPLNWLREHRDISFTLVSPDSTSGMIDPQKIEDAIKPETRLVACIHASNVTGLLQPVEEIGNKIKSNSCFFLVDGAQTVGHFPVDVQAIGCDLFAAPGHKGLLGPLGTGFLYVGANVETSLSPIRFGGTGTESENPVQPENPPEKYESGNLNIPGIAGLLAGIDFLNQNEIEKIHQQEQSLIAWFIENLKLISNVEIVFPDILPEKRLNTVSFTVKEHDPQIFATMLDDVFGIQVRAGYHCAPLAHKEIETYESGGTIRVSIGWSTTRDDMRTLIEAIKSLSEQ